MKITLENIYYSLGFLFIFLSMCYKFFTKQKNIEFNIDINGEIIKKPLEIISDSVKTGKKYIKLFDFIESVSYLSWMFIGLFTKYKFIFALLILSSFIVPLIQSVFFKENKVNVSISDKTSMFDFINFLISSVIILLIEYYHFFIKNSI